jgi:hypothetical protein
MLKTTFAALILVAGSAHASGNGVGNGRCVEGRIETFNESRGDGAPASVATFVCHNGRFVNTAPAAPAPTAPETCRDGEEVIWPTEVDAPSAENTFVCRNGRYEPKFRR